MRHGATVAVMDWDSHRYLESYFAIPMMGATLAVNVRFDNDRCRGSDGRQSSRRRRRHYQQASN